MSETPSPIVVVIHLETPEALADFLYHNDDEIIQSIHFDKEKPKPIFQFPASLDGNVIAVRHPNAFKEASFGELPDSNRGRIEELEGQVKILNEQIADLNEENTSLEQNVSALREDKQSLLDAENDMARRMRQLEDENKRFYDQNKRLCDQNMELIATMRDLQEKALKEQASRFGETTLHQLIGDNGEVVHSCMTASLPLPEDHWIYQEEKHPEPIDHKLSTEDFNKILAALRYAIRSATGSGRDMDFDPDALCMAFETTLFQSRPSQVVFESNAGEKEPNWQTDGVVQHVGFDPSKNVEEPRTNGPLSSYPDDMPF